MGGGGCRCSCIVLRESMPSRRSFEKKEARFNGACTTERGEPSGMLLGGSDRRRGCGVGIVGYGEYEITSATATRLSATGISRIVVGAISTL